MPINCSTLIQRKQNNIHKVLRSNSEGKLQNAITETTAELYVGGARKPTTTSRAAIGGGTAAMVRRPTIVTASNRTPPSLESVNEKYLPSIRETSLAIERHPVAVDTSRPKTPMRPTSATPSSVMNALAKRSMENMFSMNGDLEDVINSTPIPPPSRRSQRPAKRTSGLQRSPLENTVEYRYSAQPTDNSNTQQRSPATSSGKNRIHGNQAQIDTTYFVDAPTKDRNGTGPLYQRRTNYNVRAPIKQKIDKYRRRSEETINQTQNNNLLNVTHAGLTGTAPTLTTPNTSRQRITTIASPKPVRRVTSDAEVRARLDVLRLSMDTTMARTDEHHSHPSIKSPVLYSTHQQLVTTPTTFKTNSGILRPTHGSVQRISSAVQPQVNSVRRQNPTNQNSSATNQTNLYLAFVASRHLSNLDGAVVECDIDHPKLVRIFNWLKNVEAHRHEQRDHAELIIEQDRLMTEQEENLSLYSEIEYAVDDLPPNTAGKSFHIPSMSFEK